MLTKAAFLAILDDTNSKIGVTAHVAVFEETNGNQSLIIKQTGAPNAFLSTHKTETKAREVFTKYNAWLNEWFTQQALGVVVEPPAPKAAPVDSKPRELQSAECGRWVFRIYEEPSAVAPLKMVFKLVREDLQGNHITTIYHASLKDAQDDLCEAVHTEQEWQRYNKPNAPTVWIIFDYRTDRIMSVCRTREEAKKVAAESALTDFYIDEHEIIA